MPPNKRMTGHLDSTGATVPPYRKGDKRCQPAVALQVRGGAAEFPALDLGASELIP